MSILSSSFESTLQFTFFSTGFLLSLFIFLSVLSTSSVNTLGVSEDKIQVEAPDEVKRNKKSSKKNKKDTEEKTVKYTTNTDEVDKTDKKIKSDSKKPVEKKVNCKVDSKEIGRASCRERV